MKIAINGQQLSHFPLSQVLQVAQELGATGIELWPENVPGGDDGFRWRGRNVVSAGAQVFAANLEVACVTLGFFALPRSTSRSDAATSVVEALDAAQQLGARLVNVYLAGVPGAEFTEIMRLVAPEAETRKIVIVLENEAHDESAFPESVRDMIDSVGSPWLRTQYDHATTTRRAFPPSRIPLKSFRLGSPISILKEAGNSAKERTFIREARCVTQSERIGYGPISGAAFDLEGVVKALQGQGYEGWVALEPHVGPESILEVLRDDAAWLKSVLADSP